jgi:N6-adenosine-specific RNA methylase IME4
MIPFPQDKKFSIIYADPPWSYENKVNLNTHREYVSHISDEYSVMTFDDIYNLPVQDISEEDCLLFLWVVSPSLLEGMETGKRWGFKYITVGFVWNKINVLPGNYTMSQCEMCLIFKKGKIPLPRGSRNEKQYIETTFNEVITEHRTCHSKKPNQIRNRIASMFPDQNKIELFARQQFDGWTSWGNEVEKFNPEEKEIKISDCFI